MSEPSVDNRRQQVLAALGQYERPLVRYALRLMGDDSSARDVVQHTFVRLCEQPVESLNGQLAPWLYTVCRNRAMDLLRRRGRTESLDQSDEPSLVGDESDPADTVERDELHARLRDRVAQLPTSQSEAVTLWADGFSYPEIARIMEASEGSIRVLVHRGLTRLRNDPIARQLFDRS